MGKRLMNNATEQSPLDSFERGWTAAQVCADGCIELKLNWPRRKLPRLCDAGRVGEDSHHDLVRGQCFFTNDFPADDGLAILSKVLVWYVGQESGYEQVHSKADSHIHDSRNPACSVSYRMQKHQVDICKRPLRAAIALMKVTDAFFSTIMRKECSTCGNEELN